ncbi:hypothetical protein DL96DRAFT_1274521 [Flagelloscypha sp. PMI_526]|nr:hypothetical protein DL96DRAFT_1274521 [Flagelloscypha sp. PMI_526]
MQRTTLISILSLASFVLSVGTFILSVIDESDDIQATAVYCSPVAAVITIIFHISLICHDSFSSGSVSIRRSHRVDMRPTPLARGQSTPQRTAASSLLALALIPAIWAVWIAAFAVEMNDYLPRAKAPGPFQFNGGHMEYGIQIMALEGVQFFFVLPALFLLGTRQRKMEKVRAHGSIAGGELLFRPCLFV